MLGQGSASQAELSCTLQSCRLHFTSIGRSTSCNAVARPDCGLLHVFRAAFRRLLGEIGNALRRPKKVKKAMEAQYNQDKCVLLLCDFRSCE